MTYNPQIHHRRSIRLSGYDYAQAGAYFITICTHNRACLFGKIIDGEMILNNAGEIAYQEWVKTPQLRPHITLDVFVVMPNHMHGIIVINGRGELHSPNNHKSHPPNNPNTLHSPNNPNQSRSPNNPNNPHSPNIPNQSYSPDDDIMANKGECNSPLRSPSNTIGAIVRGYKSAVTKQINLLNNNGSVWQRNYYEHIIRNEQAYQTISVYIMNNPLKWNDDKFYAE